MTEQPIEVRFIFREWEVVFRDGRVVVWEDVPNVGAMPSMEIEQGNWRPCVTHCRNLIRMAKGREPQTNHERERRRATKPVLRLMEEGSE